MIESVMQTLLMNRGDILSILCNRPVADPVRVVRKPCDLLVLHADFVEPHRRFVLRIIHHFRIIFLALQFLFIKRRIFLRAENNRVFIDPIDMARSA